MPIACTYTPPSDKPEILHIDDDLIIVNKPAGLLSVPGRGKDKQDCLISRVHAEYPDALIVHRLDMPTSGILILARNPATHRQLSQKFQERTIKKEYIAIVRGIVTESTGEINLPLITDWPNRPKQKVDHQNGKPSLTRYEVISVNEKQQTTRLKLTPETGRSHQLRVHLLSLGHVIVGDALYSKNEAQKKTRLHLHANKIIFSHPTSKKTLCIECNCPF
ncbi:MAG TPA: RluA family pseudouridine synthase [Gammaproteobacteria bacterium]|nr:RluA family pseudouridine synthase [Gammaproteobacteria bacterium]